jgi:hypothetical protein
MRHPRRFPSQSMRSSSWILPLPKFSFLLPSTETCYKLHETAHRLTCCVNLLMKYIHITWKRRSGHKSLLLRILRLRSIRFAFYFLVFCFSEFCVWDLLVGSRVLVWSTRCLFCVCICLKFSLGAELELSTWARNRPKWSSSSSSSSLSIGSQARTPNLGSCRARARASTQHKRADPKQLIPAQDLLVYTLNYLGIFSISGPKENDNSYSNS